MKTIQPILWPLCVLLATISPRLSYAQSGLGTPQQRSGGYSVTERGPNYRVLSKATVENGTNRIHQYTELATGLNYQNSYGQWTESKEQITILPTGGAAATQGQHKVYFPANIYNGVLEVVTPDGRHLKSRPLGMCYDDGSNTVMIAILTNSIGQLVGSNQVVYPDAFDGLKGDLRYTYTRAGLEQDVIIKRQPAEPGRFGLDADSTKLQLLTEFFNTDDPTNVAPTTCRRDGLRDASLKFGGMRLARGRAFSSANAAKNRQTRGTDVFKSWVHVGSRKFLVEQVPYPRIAVEMQSLPLTADISLPANPSHPAGLNTSLAAALPPAREPAVETNQMQVAATDFNRQPGVVLDYLALNNYYTSGDFTFQSNETYYVSGYCEFDGTLTIQGGTVVKYAPGAELSVGGVACQTGPYNLATFTAKDDDSGGASIPGSTGTPSGYYASAALEPCYAGALQSMSYLRICYAEVAIINPEADIGPDLLNSQLIKCDVGIYSYGTDGYYTPNFSARNVLIDQIGTAAFYGEPFDALVENVTVSGLAGNNPSLANIVFEDDPPDYNLTLINCLGTDSVYWGITFPDDQIALGGTGCYSNLSSSVFQSSGAGNYYLANNSPYRNGGTSSVGGWANGPALLPLLRQMTTYPPVWISGDFNTDTTLYPRVPRDPGAPDPGYHYDPLDFLASSLTVESGATLTLKFGTAIGLLNNTLTIDGTLLAALQLTNVVFQEQPAGFMGAVVGSNSLVATIDSDGDGLPDWWEQTYFGNYNQTPNGDADGDGVSNLQEFLNGTDPNKIIQFSITATNDYVNHTNVSLQLDITAGVSRYYAVLVNSGTTTNWQLFTTTNLTVNLGTTDGVYDVVVGLKGYPTNAQQFWQHYEFILDRVAPVLTFTNPIIASGAATVIKPYLQLQGFGNEQLMSLSYDISNAVGVATNLDVLVTGQGFDTNQLDFTTNYFQAYDVPLTNGMNCVTLRVTDRAGNVAVTNINVTLDYATATNPPMVTLIWPQDGMAVSGTNCTLRGTMSDETGIITATVINGDGTTNLIAGMVERNRMFWLENVPLNGTSQISIQATDAAGNVTVTNFTVEPSSLVLTIDSTPTGEDLYKPTGPVSGTVSDASATVTVNGVTATVDTTANGNGTYNYSADSTPIYGQGTATFDAQANTSGQSANQNATVEMEPHAGIEFYSETETDNVYHGPGGWYQSLWTKDYTAYVQPIEGKWQMTYSGYVSSSDAEALEGGTGSEWAKYSWSDSDPGTQHSVNITGVHYDGPYFDLDDEIESVPDEDYTGTVDGRDYYMYHYYGADSWHFPIENGHHDMSISAKTGVMLHTGGKATVGRQNLFCISASAVEYFAPNATNGWLHVGGKDIDKTKLIVAGKAPGADGKVWKMLPDNSQEDITVHAPGKKHFNAGSSPQKYKLHIDANGHNLDDEKPKFCVGQKITFTGAWDDAPSTTSVDNIFWHLPDKYVNDFSHPCDTCSLDYFVNTDLLTNQTTSCWYVNKPGGACSVRETLHFSNGQFVNIAAAGNFTIYRPSVQFASAPPFTPMVTNDVLQLGPGPSMPGVMKFNATVQSTYSGVINWTQLINRYGEYGPLPLWYTSTHGDSWLDTGRFYGNDANQDTPVGPGDTDPITFNDNPGIQSRLLYANISDSFQTYLVFKPDGDSIWVTLGIVDWGWGGDALYYTSGWELHNSSVTPPTYTDSDAFPTWPKTYTGALETK